MSDSTPPTERTPTGSDRQSALSARIARVEASVNRTLESVAQQRDLSIQQLQQDRSWIARWIIRMFVIVIAAVLVILTLQGLLNGDWTQVATEATDLIKSAVLPIVTLVLGYYFGQADRN
jgi:hypothetical protein